MISIRHCERSEAIQSEREAKLGWIASSLALLAMTRGSFVPPPQCSEGLRGR